MEDVDIYRSAKVLIDQYGADAVLHAGSKIDAMLESGNLEGFALWSKVLKAIQELQTMEGKTKH